MQTSCPNCLKQLIIPDDKVSSGTALRVACPGCKEPFTVSPGDVASKQATAVTPPATTPAPLPEPDFFPPGARVALLALRDSNWNNSLGDLLKEQGYHVTTTDDQDQAVSKLQVNSYDMVILEDSEWGAGILGVIHAWPGTKRRQINVALIGEGAKSMHPGHSFRKGVDAYFHSQDHSQAPRLLHAAMEGFDATYQAWHAASKSLSKEH